MVNLTKKLLHYLANRLKMMKFIVLMLHCNSIRFLNSVQIEEILKNGGEFLSLTKF
jgi:hypothetical protein